MTLRIVVTGANRGLGLELVRAHRARGDEVWAGCRRPDQADALRTLTNHVLEVDVSSEPSIDGFAADLGEAPIDVLYNNAGIDARAFGVADDRRDALTLSGEHFLGEMRVNALGPLLVTRAVVERLRAAPAARIVNVSSQVGSMLVAQTIGRDVGYTSSKAALNMVTIKLAGLFRDDGVVVIALHPGFLRTDMNPGRGDMEAAEAAESIVALVDRLTLEDSGTFRRWDGTVHPW